MKKSLLMMAAVMFGILITFASCNNKKSSKSDADDEDEDTEEVVGRGGKSTKDIALKRVASLDDIETLAEYDLDDIDVSELSMDDIDFDNVDLDNLTESQANALLDLLVLVGNNELPEDAGDGFTVAAIDKDDESVSFVLELSPDAMDGITMEQFNQVLNMPELKEVMMTQMIQSLQGNDDFKKFLQITLVAEKDLVIKFVEEETGDSAVITLTASEQRRIQNS